MFSWWHLRTADLPAMRYSAGHLQGCFMKTKINFLGSKSSPCLKENSCQIWGALWQGDLRTTEPLSSSGDARSLSCLFFMFPHTVNHRTSSRWDVQNELHHPLNPWTPRVDNSKASHTLCKLPSPGTTCLLWQVTVGREGDSCTLPGVLSAAQQTLLPARPFEGFLSCTAAASPAAKDARDASKELWFSSAPCGPPSCYYTNSLSHCGTEFLVC